MDQAAAHAVAPERAVFQDGFGERFRSTQPGTKEQIEVLRLRSALTDVPSFEFALRERMGRLASFKHTAFGRVRSVERLRNPAPGIALVSDAVPGVRLIELLKASERRQSGLDIKIAGSLIRQLMSAVAMLHANTGGIAHGAIGPERIVITPKGRAVIVEHVLAGAVEELGYTSERSWKELRVASLPVGQPPLRIDWRTDVAQVALVALALVLARPLRDDEYPNAIDRLMMPAPAALVSWLKRAMALDGREAFSSAMQAQTDLAKVFDDGDAVAASEALEAIVSQIRWQPETVEDKQPKAPAAPARLPNVAAPAAPRPTLVAPEPVRIVERKSGVALKLEIVITWLRARDWKAASGVAGLVLALAVGSLVLRGLFASTGENVRPAVRTARAKASSAESFTATSGSAKVSGRTDPTDATERSENASGGIERRPALGIATAAEVTATGAAGSGTAAMAAANSEQPAAVGSVETPASEVTIDGGSATVPQVVGVPVTAGLRDLSAAGRAGLPPAPAIPQPPAPAPAELPAPPANRIYGAGDPGVVPPAAIRQTLPPFPGVVSTSMRAAIEVVINENGAVESATLRDHITPAYDTEVLSAVAAWRYRPATLNGAAVKYRKVIGITVANR